MRLGKRIWVHDDDSDVKYDRLVRKKGRIDDGEPITLYEFERVGYNGSVIGSYQKFEHEIDA